MQWQYAGIIVEHATILQDSSPTCREIRHDDPHLPAWQHYHQSYTDDILESRTQQHFHMGLYTVCRHCSLVAEGGAPPQVAVSGPFQFQLQDSSWQDARTQHGRLPCSLPATPNDRRSQPVGNSLCEPWCCAKTYRFVLQP